jgi:hypothetical protein
MQGLSRRQWRREPADIPSDRKTSVNCRAHKLGNISNTIFPGIVAWLVRPCSVTECHPRSQTIECMVEIQFPWKISRPHLCYKSVFLLWAFMSFFRFDLPMLSICSGKVSQLMIKHHLILTAVQHSNGLWWNESPQVCKIKGEILQIWHMRNSETKESVLKFQVQPEKYANILSSLISDADPIL